MFRIRSRALLVVCVAIVGSWGAPAAVATAVRVTEEHDIPVDSPSDTLPA